MLPEASRPKNLPLHVESQGYIFYPAAFWKHKNHILIIEAMGSLKQLGAKMVHVVFTGSKVPVIAGDDPDSGSFTICESRAHELGISDYVHRLGFVSRSELSYLYDHAKALTFVSWFGPDNLPPLEAFSRECPVIAADVPGAREQLKDACQYIDPASMDSLRDALVKLDATPDMVADMVQKGKRIVAERTGADYARTLEAILGNIMPGCLRAGRLQFSDEGEEPRS
jgi:glycosyltransferase involved in cell wall biosynthesis